MADTEVRTTRVLRRRGTDEENNIFTGYDGELTIDTTNHTIRVHDGDTAGGYVVPTRKIDESQTTPGSYSKVVVDSNGFVIGSESLIPADIPDLSDRYIPRNTPISANTKIKISYDAKGLVTGGSDLTSYDIPALPISKITDLQSSLDDKQEAIKAVAMSSTSGNIRATDNAINYVEITGSCTILMPDLPADIKGVHQFVVQLKKTNVNYDINLNAAKYFGGVMPTLNAVGYYNIYYEYDYNIRNWVAGAIYKGDID